MKCYAGFSVCEDKEYGPHVDNEGFVETDDLESVGLEWVFNDGDDGPVDCKGVPVISISPKEEIDPNWDCRRVLTYLSEDGVHVECIRHNIKWKRGSQYLGKCPMCEIALAVNRLVTFGDNHWHDDHPVLEAKEEEDFRRVLVENYDELIDCMPTWLVYELNKAQGDHEYFG